MAAQPTLPSFTYLPTDGERPTLALPWDPAPEAVVGVFAREQGALVPARQVASAKSWLSNAAVDRTAPLLPWASDHPLKLSPVDASARVLRHLRDAWNHEHPAARLEDQPIVLTVPASFDEEARELTVQAARETGFAHLTLLEEPLAALYAWIATHRHQTHVRAPGFGGQAGVRPGSDRGQTGVRPGSDQGQTGVRPGSDLGLTPAALGDGALVLVVDVGGGTTDFSLIRTAADAGDLTFERIAVGEHLLLGGDNLDVALAVHVERLLTGDTGRALTLQQRQTLRRKCSAAKERLLSDPSLDHERITILGGGRGVVGGGLTADLPREDVERMLGDGFLPLTDAGDLPARDRRAGLRELGLPFESEPAITRHLAAFLTRAARQAQQDGMVTPDAVLFNGGFFTPPIARERVVAAIEAWAGRRPLVLENERPEAAVAIGAAFYGKLRQDPEASRRLLIRAGSARAYYVGVEPTMPEHAALDHPALDHPAPEHPAPEHPAPRSRLRAEGATAGQAPPHPDAPRRTPTHPDAVCVLPRGTQEGTAFDLDREFTVITNQAAAFTLFSSSERDDGLNDLVTFDPADPPHRHAPLVTALRFGKRSRRVPLAVRLSAVFTETGTLELWCRSTTTEHRWRLAFNLRATEQDPLDVADAEDTGDEDQVVVGDEAIAQALDLLRGTFGPDATRDATAVVGDLENALGHGKHAWPMGAIRRMADVLIELEAGRVRSAAHEARWLNLTGFCARPGFGAPADEWRVSQLRPVYAAGLTHAKDVQCQVEWLVLWQRVAAGFSAGQQRELAQRVIGQLGIGQKKPARPNPQIEREGWRLLGSLERLDAGHKAKLGDELLPRIRREPRNAARLWTLGRLGARAPLYGPLNAVAPPAVAERWMEALMALKDIGPDAAAAIVQIGAETSDPARDVSADLRRRAIARLEEAGVPPDALAPLRTVVRPDRAAATRAFGESLPQGLRIA
jgi:molecular chaperone DnaK (HSP70)